MSDCMRIIYCFGFPVPDLDGTRLNEIMVAEGYEDDLDGYWDEAPVAIATALQGHNVQHNYIRVKESEIDSIWEITAVPNFKVFDPKTPKWDGMIRNFCEKHNIPVHSLKMFQTMEEEDLSGVRPKIHNYPRWIACVSHGT